MSRKSKLGEDAKQWIKENKKTIIQKFADPSVYPKYARPLTVFMAGSPGSGKTEFSKTFIKVFSEGKNILKIVRIDPDEVRNMLPQYKQGNAYQVQGAAAIGVEKLFDYVQQKGQNCIVDGTFSNLSIAKKDIDRALRRKRDIMIIYLYQDPLVAWDFTKKREKMEGRRVTKKFFIETFFASFENIKIIKESYGDTISLFIFIKNYENKIKKFFPYVKIDEIDKVIKLGYTQKELEKKLL